MSGVTGALNATTADGRPKGVTGAVGAAIPADAPQETAQPITGDALQVMQARAAQNEKPLPPFNPTATAPRTQPAPAAPTPATAPAAQVNRTIRRVARPAVPGSPAAPTNGIILTDADFPDLAAPNADDLDGTGQALIDQVEDLAPVDPALDALPPLTDEDRARMPAASDSDSPSRGVPKVHPGQMPVGKEITGGFSDALDAQYFPLDGSELCQLVLGLFDTLAAQLPNDLRFSMALTYPRVRARVRVEIEGHADDADCGFVIEKIAVPQDGEPGGTALDIARARAREVVFVVQAMRQEVTVDGESDLPPDAIRDELGLPKPQKQLITDQHGRQTIVDQIPTGIAALTR